ncbi:MAG: FitA-like ribbon-helix-helix domain-containing protein [Methylohalobius sp. ZOD2]
MPATITLKNIPDDLYRRLKETAKVHHHHRSINGEVIVCLEQALLPTRLTGSEQIARARQLRSGLKPGDFKADEISRAIDQGRP